MGDSLFSEHSNEALYALLARPSVKWSVRRERLHETSVDELMIEEFGSQLFDSGSDAAIEEARAEILLLRSRGVEVATMMSSMYPPQLRQVHDNPPVLYMKGTMCGGDELSVAIVGTRTPSEPAQKFAGELAARLGLLGIPVVSGLARGIDTIAMTASLEVGNRTIGVLGTGFDYSYPPENAQLQEEVADNHLLISQFKPTTHGSKATFPMRNVVMSGFASLTVIVEAGENSGTRIQARAAMGHGRPVIITRAVQMQTSWGASLAARGGSDVFVVSDAMEAVEAVEHIHRSEKKALEDAANLVGTLSL